MTDPSRPPRIHDVAQIAGVSVATVSRVMSNPSIVAQATREAVEAAIEATGYTVNLTARNLRQQQVGGVLALVPKLANPFFSEILAGISQVLRREGLSLLVIDTATVGDQPVHEALAPYLSRSRSDGVIVMDGGVDADLLSGPGCPPVVQACEWNDMLDVPRVLADNVEGGRIAAAHLTSLGHRALLHLTGPARNTLTIDRRRGFLAGLAEAGFDEDAGPQMPGDFGMASGFAAAERILRLKTRPTAVFCDNDEMAIGLITGLLRAGVSVPGDVSVMGFDNIEMSAYCLPALTTIRQHRARLGRRAAEVLLSRMRGAEVEANTVLGVELLTRASTGPA